MRVRILKALDLGPNRKCHFCQGVVLKGDEVPEPGTTDIPLEDAKVVEFWDEAHNVLTIAFHACMPCLGELAAEVWDEATI